MDMAIYLSPFIKYCVLSCDRNGYKVVPHGATVFEIMGHLVASSETITAQFCLAKQTGDSVIIQRFQEIEDGKDAIFISQDLLRALGITIIFREHTIEWDAQCLKR